MSPYFMMLSLVYAPVLAALGALHLWKWYRRLERRRSPLVRKVLRAPGQSLLERNDDLAWDISAALGILVALPGIFLSAQGYRAWETGSPSFWSGAATPALIAIGVLSGVVVWLVMLVRRRQRLMEGYRAEVATAQGLDPLKTLGCVIFHDIPADGFNIDHVIVAPSGIYAVETKSRRKPTRGQGLDDARVTFDGERLRFPDWTERKPLEQTKAQARWLEKYLSGATGSRVPVRPLLALPGWFVERTGRGDVLVINPEKCNWIAKSNGGPGLSAEAMGRLIFQLERLCGMDPTGASSSEGRVGNEGKLRFG